MKWRIVIFFIHCAVFTAQSMGSNADVEERWSWGYADETTEQQDQYYRGSTTEFPGYDPCVPYNPPKPNFKAPGRRINEEKCEEYIYDLKLTDERKRRAKECRPNDYESTYLSIIGGRPALPGEFPYMGTLGWKMVTGTYAFKCGSTLISSKFVMTAGHCTSAPPDTSIEDLDPKIVRLNDYNIITNPNGSTVSSRDQSIARIITHPNYNSPKKYYDIALIELAREVYFTPNLKPACLWNRPDTGSFGNKLSLTGWVVFAPESFETPHLQVADVDMIDSVQCENLLEEYHNRHWQGLAEDQLCAGRLEGGVDACQGASGGPLQFRKPIYSSHYSKGKIYYVIGVTSFGVGCALPNHPGIYTRVSSFIDIQSMKRLFGIKITTIKLSISF